MCCVGGCSTNWIDRILLCAIHVDLSVNRCPTRVLVLPLVGHTYMPLWDCRPQRRLFILKAGCSHQVAPCQPHDHDTIPASCRHVYLSSVCQLPRRPTTFPSHHACIMAQVDEPSTWPSSMHVSHPTECSFHTCALFVILFLTPLLAPQCQDQYFHLTPSLRPHHASSVMHMPHLN